MGESNAREGEEERKEKRERERETVTTSLEHLICFLRYKLDALLTHTSCFLAMMPLLLRLLHNKKKNYKFEECTTRNLFIKIYGIRYFYTLSAVCGERERERRRDQKLKAISVWQD